MFSFRVNVKAKDKEYMTAFQRAIYESVLRCCILTQRAMKIVVGKKSRAWATDIKGSGYRKTKARMDKSIRNFELATNRVGKMNWSPLYRQTKWFKNKGMMRPVRIYHVPSLPGDPPARDTGTLTSSIDYNVKAIRYITGGYRSEVLGTVGANVQNLKTNAKRGKTSTMPDYAYYLEHGTGRMKARPYLQRSLDKAKPEFAAQFVKAMKRHKIA